MATYHYVVLTKATEGQEEEFHKWYDNQHLPDCVAAPGVKSAKRYRLLYGVGPSSEGSPKEPCPYDSLAIYEFETDDPIAVAKELSGRAGSPAMLLTDALNRTASVKYVAQPAGEIPAKTANRG